VNREIGRYHHLGSLFLQASQNCSKTPSKGGHPSKYDYQSPVKTLRKSMAPRHSGEPDKRGNKKRIQLFTSPRKETRSSPGPGGGQATVQELQTVEINDDLIFKKLGVDSTAESKFASIEERYSGTFSRKSPANLPNERLRLGSGNISSSNNNNNSYSAQSKKFSRRSLDSATFNNNSSGNRLVFTSQNAFVIFHGATKLRITKIRNG